jgi:hypothetical protein
VTPIDHRKLYRVSVGIIRVLKGRYTHLRAEDLVERLDQLMG